MERKTERIFLCFQKWMCNKMSWCGCPYFLCTMDSVTSGFRSNMAIALLSFPFPQDVRDNKSPEDKFNPWVTCYSVPFDSQRLCFLCWLEHLQSFICFIIFACMYVGCGFFFLPSCLHVGEHMQLHYHCPSTVCHVLPLAKFGHSFLEILVFAV